MASAVKSLTFDLFGRDKSASSAVKGVGKAADGLNKTFMKVGAAIGAAFAVGKIIDFGQEAVKAFAESEKQQLKLQDALTRYPAVQGANLKALQEWNSELAKKTRYDDDAIAAAEAQLLQYGLNEDQLRRIIPLTLDYAARTGKDLAGASEDLGKALMGQGRALKNLGLDFQDTGSLAGNFDALIAGLGAQVSGFAEKDVQTAEGRLENLKNRFGEIQEQIGEPLVDAISALADEFEDDLLVAAQGFADWLKGDGIEAIKGFIDFIVDHKDDFDDWAAGIGAVTGAMWLLNAAMLANPAGVLVGGLIAVAGASYLLTETMPEAGKAVSDFGTGAQRTFLQVAKVVVDAFSTIVNAGVAAFNFILGPINTVRRALGLSDLKLGNVNFAEMSGVNKGLWANQFLANAQSSYYGPKVNPGAYVPSMNDWKLPGMAEGGVVLPRAGGLPVTIGEGRYAEAVIPLSEQILSQMGGTKEININVHGVDGPTAVGLLEQRLRASLVGVR